MSDVEPRVEVARGRPRAEAPDASTHVVRGQWVLGALSWFSLVAAVVVLAIAPDVLWYATVVVIAYLAVRMTFTAVFSAICLKRCREWGSRDWTDAAAGGRVHHLVLVPNFDEPTRVLETTLEAIAQQARAREDVSVVLAMEQREPGAREKADQIADRFQGRFANLFVTVHPADLPGELRCKGANATWAVREVRPQLEKLGIAADSVLVTTCDADSVLHRGYLTAVGRMFSKAEDRYDCLWQPPVLFLENVWDVPLVVRVVAYLAQGLQMAELANPIAKPITFSTYSLSLRLLEDAGYWDPAIISDDWHVYLSAYFARGGRIAVRRVFLTVIADMPGGGTWWESVVAAYRQGVRDGWGAQDVGYIAQSWRKTAVPALRTTALLEKVTRDHLLRTVPWIIFSAGSIVPYLVVLRLAPNPVSSPLAATALLVLWVALAVATLSVLFVGLVAAPPPTHKGVIVGVLLIGLAWIALPFILLALVVAPALDAETRLMFGRELSWQVTPKGRPASSG